MFSSGVWIWSGNVWMGDDDSYLGYGGIHPGAIQRDTPAEESV